MVSFGDRYLRHYIRISCQQMVVFYFFSAVDADLYGDGLLPLYRPCCADRQEQLNVASFVCFSDRYAECYPEKVMALKKNSRRKIKTDYVFHSVISAAGVRSSVADESLDIFH